MWGFAACLIVSVVEWFLVAKRTTAIAQNSPWVGPLVAVEVAIGLAAGYVVFVQQSIPGLIGCAIGAGLGAEFARRRRP